MSNKRINKAYVRYDGTGRVISGSLILNRFKPKVGNWSEIPAYECCNPTPVELALRFLFDDIANANLLVGDASSLEDWNTFFDLPTNGSPFTSVVIVGNEVQLFGGSGISIRNEAFYDIATLLQIIDDAGCIFEVGETCFYYSTQLNTLILPNAINIGYGSFDSCYSLTTITLPSCTNLGGTVGYNYVFYDVSGNSITLTVPAALMTADAGSPDGDIVYLQANNTVTVVTV